ncbi:uncharacterized protein PV09_04013 [Verruconis gallopava]|uniref:J domain-containing protein n=1 Tax=Verruconis gallopava TaxID=253628 RepID=A0A0D2AEE3_9PEZI|nr:uncharacterized protein PV09_04013 [Verruconis gallopava]KIW04830.1 hypothetical protein PV09_04013 [Verruconis gallopava]
MSTEYNYDEQGQFFPYFILTIAAIVTVPTTYSWLKPSKELENTAARIQTDYRPDDADLVDKVKSKQRRRERRTKRMLVSIAGWAVMVGMVYLIIVTARTIPKVWDPYEVLGISYSASEKQIKSHYRKLSLTHHPDKVKIDPALNQTVESVNEHWVEITKAFKALTDEEVRRNYLEYGHPDGKQSFSIGLALPAFLVAEGNGKYVMLFYLSLLGVAVPYFVGRWWYGSQKKTKEGIYVNSAGTLFQTFREETNTSAIIEACSGADEYKELLQGEKAESGLARIEQRVLAPSEFEQFASGLTAKDEKKLKQMDDPQRRKTLALIWAYLGRIDLEDAILNDEKFEVGPIAQLLNEAFTIIALHFGAMEPVLNSYRLSQCLLQAIPPAGSPLLQLPHFTPKVVAAIEGVKSRKHLSVQKFMAIPPNERKSKVVGPGLLDERQYQQAMSIASNMPYLHVERAFFKVHGERYVTPNSLVQFVVKARVIPPGSTNVPHVTEADLEEPDKDESRRSKANEVSYPPPLAHAPYFARDHSPKWNMFLGDAKQGKIVVPPFTFAQFDKPIFHKDTGLPTFEVQTLKMQFGAPPQPGVYTFQMHLVCDSYLGLDTKMNVTMEVKDATMAEDIGDGGEISDPDEDSLAGQMAMMKGERVKRSVVRDESSGSDTEGDEALDEDSTTDTETDTDDE